MKLGDFLIERGYVIDKSEAKRFLVQNEVVLNGSRTDCWAEDLQLNDVLSIITSKSFKVFRVK